MNLNEGGAWELEIIHEKLEYEGVWT